ncbi:TetR/AcrR family transcriptional regulator [Longispora albida]|uniref:TetR/AcrR family transcriptional regulator n=1 Tax=Longispora albida TaxID=203523 RepID=UPI000688F82B|nr:TetR/AcrR family transcriptional regulator [Longispora albida]
MHPTNRLETAPPARPLRADAARNREALLAAASAEFAAHGADASVADIARRAGIGKGTVFRHFPTKEHLLGAIVLDRLVTISELGEDLLGAGDAGRALLEFLTAACERVQQLDLSFLLAASPAVLAEPAVSAAQERMFGVVGALVARAQEQGAVRADVTGPDVILLMCAPSHAASPLQDSDPGLWRRYLGVLFDGLRPEGAHPLPHPPPAAPVP